MPAATANVVGNEMADKVTKMENRKKTFKVEGLYTSLFSSRLPASNYMFNVNNRNTRTIYINKLHPQIYLN